MIANMEKWRPDPERAYERSKWLLVFLAIYALDQFPGFYFQDKIPHAVAIVLGWGIYFLLFRLALFLAHRFLKGLISPLGVEIALLCLIAYTIDDIQSATASLGPSEIQWMYGITVVVTFSLWLFALGMEKRKRHPILGVLGTGALLAVVFIAAFPGVQSRGAIRGAKKEIPPRYEVETIHYGPGENFDFGTENYGSYVKLPKRQSGVREKYFGYTPSKVPYEGELYLPKGVKNAPLMVFVHGNHNMLEDNYKGYAYLGRYLAERGIAFASVEQSYLNAYLQKGISGENDARALSLIDHADALLKDKRLASRFDPKRLYFGGHSRGGEAAAVAAAFTTMSANPDTGGATKDLEVAGVLAVAPTDSQYEPGDRPVELKVPYFIVQGTYDQDVSSMEGMDQYMRTDAKKTQVLLHYANHTQFNDNWGRLDREGLLATTLYTADIMPKADQQRFLQIMAYHFIEGKGSLKGIKDYLPDVDYMLAEERPGLVIADFEEDGELTTATAEGATMTSVDGVHTEGIFTPSGRGGNNHVAYMRGTLQLDIEEAIDGDFAMDLAPTGSVGDLKITLTDEAGETIELAAKDAMQASFRTTLLKWQSLANDPEYKSSLETYRLTKEEVASLNPAFNMAGLRQITITADREIALDNVRIERKND